MSDPFETLGLSPTFDLDPGELEKRHRELSKALHPDRFAACPASERRQALGKAIEVNAAWRSLRDPVERARALLARLGVVVHEGSEPAADPELLMQVMELREELSDAGRQRDEERLGRLVADIRARESRTLEGLAEDLRAALDRGDAATRTEPIVRRIGELRFYKRFLDEAAAIQDEL